MICRRTGRDFGMAIVFLTVCVLSSAVPPSDSVFTLMVCPSGDQRPRNSEGDIVKLKNGRLLLAYGEFVGTDGSDFGSARISAKTSRNGGHSWSSPYVLIPNEGKMNVMSPSLLRLQSGKLALTYTIKNSQSDNQIWFRISSDEAKSWSDPVRINSRRATGGSTTRA